MKRLASQFAIISGCLIAMTACSYTPGPVLYPNAKLNEVGQAQSSSDIEACKQLAATNGVGAQNSQLAEAAGNTAYGAAAGAAIGAVGGAILGDTGTGAAFGAATGATEGAVGSVLSEPELSPAYKGFVDNCLREKGYQPVGWE